MLSSPICDFVTVPLSLHLISFDISYGTLINHSVNSWDIFGKTLEINKNKHGKIFS